ncbi:hypothetical protein ACE939_10975 [Aquimarina sp. W85]|uniref:hypothetical protein n=1 Tax=Aquimarina rhodophyticola TaxID=3342246 RepID=UPI00366CA4BC
MPMLKAKIIAVFLFLKFLLINAQTLNVEYLNPSLGSGDPYSYIRFGTLQNYKAGFLWNKSEPDFGDGDDFSIFTYNDRDLTFRTGMGNIILQPKFGGNIGIGTTSPVSMLDVNGKTTLNSLRIDGRNAIHSVNGFVNKIEFTGYANSAIVFAPGETRELMFGFHGDGKFYWGTGKNATKPNFYSMFLDGNTGNLGIRGRLTANEVRVKVGGWADYVFKEDYKLKPLDEIEKYIQEKGHLPNIPSEEDVLNDGILLGEMNLKLLEKIEELTLYMIAQEKEIDLLKKRSFALEKQNQQLKTISLKIATIENKLKAKE